MNASENGQARPGRKLRIVLFASLALNLMVVGLAVGVLAVHRFGADHRPPRINQVGGPMARALSEADRHRLVRSMRDAYREQRPDRAAIQAEFERVIATLETRPYDSQAVRASVERQMRAVTEGARLGRELLLDRLEEMSDAERAAYAARLRDVLEGKHRPGHSHQIR